MTYRAQLLKIAPADALEPEMRPFARAAAVRAGRELGDSDRVALFQVVGSMSIQAVVLEGLKGEEGFKSIERSFRKIELEISRADAERLRLALR